MADTSRVGRSEPRAVTRGSGLASAPDGVGVRSPTFNATAADLIAGIVTERGVIRPVNATTVRQMLSPS